MRFQSAKLDPVEDAIEFPYNKIKFSWLLL